MVTAIDKNTALVVKRAEVTGIVMCGIATSIGVEGTARGLHMSGDIILLLPKMR